MTALKAGATLPLRMSPRGKPPPPEEAQPLTKAPSLMIRWKDSFCIPHYQQITDDLVPIVFEHEMPLLKKK